MEIDVKAWAPRLAKSVLRDALRLKEGETVTIEAWTRSLPWVDAFLVEARAMGARPMVIYDSDDAFWTNIEHGREKSLGTLGRQELAAIKESDAYIYFWGPSDRTRWHKLPDSTMKSLTAYEDEWFKVAEEKGLRFCRIELGRATVELAKEYGISYTEWVEELLEASTIRPESMMRNGKKIAERIEKGSQIIITHDNGTKLELRLKGRKAFVDDGVIDEDDVKAGHGDCTIPSGYVMVALDEDFAEGKFKSNITTSHFASRGRSGGGEWIFKQGKLSKYSYQIGEKNFSRLYQNGGEIRDRVGKLHIGLNPKIHHIAPLLEDQELGVVSLFIGSNEWLGGTNKGDFTSWLNLRGANLTIDGEPLLKNGKIV